MSVGLYAKAVAGAVVSGLTAAITALTDGNITGYEWTVIVGAFLVGLGAVFATSNTAGFRYAKAVVAALVAGVAALGTALLDGGGVSSGELLGVVVALVSGLGLVGVTPNADVSDELNDYNDYDPQDDAPDETVVAGV